jgi:hypothetical protein
MSLRARGGERESKSNGESESESGKGKGTGKGQGKWQGKGQGKGKGQGQGKWQGERQSTKALAILFLNRLGQSEKSANYTVLYSTGKSGIVSTVNNLQG